MAFLFYSFFFQANSVQEKNISWFNDVWHEVFNFKALTKNSTCISLHVNLSNYRGTVKMAIMTNQGFNPLGLRDNGLVNQSVGF